jgi:hypothetical protein
MKAQATSRKHSGPAPKPLDAVFGAYSPAVRARLERLRRLVLETAAKMDGVGEIEEALRWGQLSFLSRGGSTIRVGAVNNDPRLVAMFFICHTDLIATFRELYPELDYDGNRAILIGVRGRLPEDALRHCISLALTYKARR